MTLPAALALALAAPRWLDRTLAGYAMEIDAKHEMTGVRDAKRGFYLLRTSECDGAIVTLTLTRDRNVVAAEGFAVPNFIPKSGDNGSLPLVEKSLPSLATGKGVLIGDSPASVRRRLGTPTETKGGAPLQNFLYKGKTKGHPKAENEQRYTFKNLRLIEIQFFRDASPK